MDDVRAGDAHPLGPARPIWRPPRPRLAEAGAQTLAFLKEHIGRARTVPLAGNSIGTDRRFLATQLPEIEDFFHYRSVDVSTVKELARRWRPEVYKAAPEKKGGHRALQDIRESVAELAYYRGALFDAPAVTAPARGPAARTTTETPEWSAPRQGHRPP